MRDDLLMRAACDMIRLLMLIAGLLIALDVGLLIALAVVIKVWVV